MSHIIKTLIFVALLGVFYVAGGFDGPRLSSDDYRSPRRMGRACSYTMILFVAGAGIAVWGDKTVGVLHPQSFRALFIILGVLLMLTGLLWMRMIKSTDTQRPNHALQRTRPSHYCCNPRAPQAGSLSLGR